MPAAAPTTARQLALYEDTADIWKPDTVVFLNNITGEPRDTTYTRIATGQACYYFTKTETTEAAIVGRYPADIIFTLDVLKFPSGVLIDEAYVVKLTTPTHELLNTFWRVIGDPLRRTNRSHRHPNFAQVYVKKLPQAPPGVS